MNELYNQIQSLLESAAYTPYILLGIGVMIFMLFIALIIMGGLSDKLNKALQEINALRMDFAELKGTVQGGKNETTLRGNESNSSRGA